METRNPGFCRRIVVRSWTHSTQREQALPAPFVSDQPETSVSGCSYSSMYHSSMECMNTMPISSTRPLGTFLMRAEVLVG